MKSSVPTDGRPGANATEAALKMLRYLGMLGFLGGLAALSAMWAFGPVPDNVEGWRLLIGLMRPIFFTCSFMGIVLLVIAGSVSWWRHRRELHAARWFRVMLLMLAFAVPALHLSARTTALKLYAAVQSGELNQAAEYWNRLGWLYLVGFVVMLCISAIGVFKPSLKSQRQSRTQPTGAATRLSHS